MSKPQPAYEPMYGDAHRRAASRLRLSAPAIFFGHGGKQKVTLLDISQTGAKLAFREPPKGDAGFIHWMGYETFGELVWREGLYAGFQFDEELPMDWLIDTRHRSEHVGVEEHARVLRAAREWVGGSRI